MRYRPPRAQRVPERLAAQPGKIQTHRRSWPQPIQRDRVRADVTLQMHDVEPVEPTQLRQVVSQLGRQEIGSSKLSRLYPSGPVCSGTRDSQFARLMLRQSALTGLCQTFMATGFHELPSRWRSMLHRYQPITDSHTELIKSRGPASLLVTYFWRNGIGAQPPRCVPRAHARLWRSIMQNL